MTESYKVALFLTRAQAVEANEFSARWLSASPPLRTAGLYRHVHNAAVMADLPIENAPPAPYDGVDEYEFETAALATDFFISAPFVDHWLKPRAALLASGPLVLSGMIRRVWERPGGRPATDAVKILTLPVRRAGMSMEAFFTYWTVDHAGLALSGPGTRERAVRLVSTYADKRPFPGLGSAPFDGIGNIVFEGRASLQAEFASEHYRERLAPDEPRFTDPQASRAMMVNETVLLPA